jgi:hypothetical protein
MQSLAQGAMGVSPDPSLLTAIQKIEFDVDGNQEALSEREKMILTTTGSIFQKLVDKKEDLNEYDLSKLQSFNEDNLKSLINLQRTQIIISPRKH